MLGVALLVGLMAMAGSAGGVEHRVVKEETLADVAQAFYADPRLGPLLAATNGIAAKTHLEPGARITVPHATAYKTRTGDSWEALARKYMGDARRAGLLARANGFSAGSKPPFGVVVFLPFHVKRKVSKKDSFRSLAEEFYDDPRKADSLREYNYYPTKKKRPARPDANSTVVIPIFHARVRPAKLKPPTGVTPTKSSDPDPVDDPAEKSTVETALALAKGYFGDGLYSRVVTTLAPVLEADALTRDERIEALEMNGASLVALDDEEAAIGTYRALLEVVADYDPDPELTSPKILKTLKKARK